MTKPRQARGNCFERTFKLMMAFDDRSAFHLVHGIVWHPDVGYHVHAWIENDSHCLDYVGRRLCAVEKSQYYRIGKIKKGKTQLYKFSRAQAIARANETGRYDFTELPCSQ